MLARPAGISYSMVFSSIRKMAMTSATRMRTMSLTSDMSLLKVSISAAASLAVSCDVPASIRRGTARFHSSV